MINVWVLLCVVYLKLIKTHTHTKTEKNKKEEKECITYSKIKSIKTSIVIYLKHFLKSLYIQLSLSQGLGIFETSNIPLPSSKVVIISANYCKRENTYIRFLTSELIFRTKHFMGPLGQNLVHSGQSVSTGLNSDLSQYVFNL